MTIKEKIKEYLTQHPESKLTDLYIAFSEVRKETIRSTLNHNIKNGYFTRVSKGVYK